MHFFRNKNAKYKIRTIVEISFESAVHVYLLPTIEGFRLVSSSQFLMPRSSRMFGILGVVA